MVPTKDVVEDLLALERQYWDAVKEKDSASAKSLSEDPCVIVGAQGVREVDRKTLGRMLEDGSYSVLDYGIDGFHARQVTDDVVVVAYKVKENLVVDGEDVALEAFDSSVWVRREGGWLCALHTESPAGDRFASS